jgi:hypothetical protein
LVTKQLKINLDTILNPNPAIRERYGGNNALELALELGELEKVEWQLERRLFQPAQAGGKGIKHKINAIYRKRVGRQEFALMFNPMVTYDYFNNQWMQQGS